MAKRRDSSIASREETLERKNVILAALGRATGNTARNEISGGPDPADIYYTLSPEEIRALIDGDMGKIESWVNNLDRQHAAWLLSRLIKENW